MLDVFVLGVGVTPFRRRSPHGWRRLAAMALTAALEEADTPADALGAVLFANGTAGLLDGQEMVRGHLALAETGLDGAPIIDVEAACASGSAAFTLACQWVSAGSADVVAAVGAEQLSHEDRSRTFAAIGSAKDVRGGIGDTESRSPFLDVYVGLIERFRERTGATDEDFARVAVKAHRHAALNELAQYRDPVTVEEVLDSRMVVPPLRLLMCSPTTDGAAAAIVASAEGLRRLGRSPADAVRVRSSVLRSGRTADGTSAARSAAKMSYEQAELGPDDVELAEVHDAVAPAELMAYEALGFAKAEDTVALLREGTTSLGGALPVNPSGGLLCRGHPIGASGLAQLAEVTWQLRGRAGRRQVERAGVGLVHNAGGWVGDDSAAAAVHILQSG